MIERCTDYRRVKKFVDDVIVSNEVYYLMVTDGKDLGVWSFVPYLDGLVIHADMGVDCRGKAALEALKSCFSWVFSNTKYGKIYACIANSNRPAQRIAATSGMECIEAHTGHRGYVLKKGFDNE